MKNDVTRRGFLTTAMFTGGEDYLIYYYTTAFEIRVGNWRMYHTGDCWNVAKLNPLWGERIV